MDMLCNRCKRKPRISEKLQSCLACRRNYCKYTRGNKEKRNEKHKLYVNKVKLQVFTEYGLSCVCCSESIVEFLSIDHINGYKTGPRSGTNLYNNIIQNNYPKDYRLLCLNCNTSLGSRNYCPHKSNKREFDIDSSWPQQTKSKRKLKMEVLAAYGNKCVCCLESLSEFLTVDHIFNNGAFERKLHGAGNSFYTYLRRYNFPKDKYQLLCFNCNFAKYQFKRCPHVMTTPDIMTPSKN